VATKKKGLLATSGEWARHLRRWGKRAVWHKERKAAQRDAKEQIRAG
jgi:hypothetical protein